MKTRKLVIIGIVIAVGIILISLVVNEIIQTQKQDYTKLLKGADKNIDIAHHIDIILINSTKHAFSIKSINLNSDDSISVNFGGSIRIS